MHGASNKMVVAILEDVCTRRLHLDIKATCFRLGDYICHKCITMIENVDLSIKKAVLKENELVEKLEVSMGLIRGRKRIDPDSDMDGHNETRSTPSSTDWIFEKVLIVIVQWAKRQTHHCHPKSSEQLLFVSL